MPQRARTHQRCRPMSALCRRGGCLMLLLLWCLVAAAQSPPDGGAEALRSDTGLAIETGMVDDPAQARAAIDEALQSAEGSRPGRTQGLLRLLEGKLALINEDLAQAERAFSAAESLLRVDGSPRDLSRLGLQRLHVLARSRTDPIARDAQFEAAALRSRAAGDDWAVANIYLLRGYVAAQASEFAKAMDAAEQGLAVARGLVDHRLTALLLNNLANARKNLGMLGGALDAHFQALALRRELGDERTIIQSLSNIVLVYQRMEDWEEARRYSEEALQRSRQGSSIQERTRIALNHAALLVDTGSSADAESALQLLEDIGSEVERSWPQWRYSLLSSKALALNRLQRHEAALVAAQDAVSAARSVAGSELVEVLHALATVQMAQTPAQLEPAARTLAEAIALAEQVQVASLESTLRQQLASVLERQGDLAGALREWKHHQAINERIHGLDQVRRIAGLEQQVANAGRERELQEMRTRDLLQQGQISRQRWLGGMGIVTLLAVALALYSRFRYAQKRAHAMELAREALSQQNLLLEKMANTDALTGLRNRQWMHKELEARAQARTTAGGVLAILDIDHFKTINDSYGHDVGDAVLIGIARLMQQLPARVACARWGGEEFILLLPDEPATSIEVLDQLRLALAGLRDWPVAMTVTCSIGAAARVADEDSAAWLKRADLALYAAKRNGRNQVVTAETTVVG